MDDPLAVQAELLIDWCAEHFDDLVQVIFRGDRRPALAAWAAAEADLAAAELPADVVEAARIRLRYLRWQAEQLGVDENERRALRRRLIDDYMRYRGSELAEARCHVYLLQLRSTELRDGVADYPAEDFWRDYNAIPPRLKIPELLHSAAGWAYLKRELTLLEEILGALTLTADGYMSDYVWQRANLLHLLANGRARPLDVVQMIQRIKHPLTWQDFDRLMFADCLREGLFDLRACQALAQMLCALEANPPEPPQRSSPTNSMRGV